MTERVEKTAAYIREKLAESTYYVKNPEAGAYRLEHTYRVARIGAEIARQEGIDEEAMVIGCLLHDLAYSREFVSREDWLNHGREGAAMARPYLEKLGLAPQFVEEICYGIAIHVDDKADWEGERTPLALSIGDADNIDRFDVYRLFETLDNVGFRKMTLAEKKQYVSDTRKRLDQYVDFPFATAAATALWRERVEYYREFYRRLDDQLAASVWGKTEDGCAAVPGQQAADWALGLARQY